MRRLNSGGGDLPKISGFVKVKNMVEGEMVSGTYRSNLTTKGEFPKLNYIIQLARPLTFTTYDSQKKANVSVSANVGDVIALESTTVLAANLPESMIGQEITIVYEGKSKTKKPGQRPAYLVGVYAGLPEEETAPKAAPKKASGFPFNQ